MLMLVFFENVRIPVPMLQPSCIFCVSVNIRLVGWSGFMAYQTLLVIKRQIYFFFVNNQFYFKQVKQSV